MGRAVVVAIAAETSLAARTFAFAATDRGATTDPLGGTGVENDTTRTGYAPVNGRELYYEIHGAGEPLVLLHGAYGTAAMFERGSCRRWPRPGG